MHPPETVVGVAAPDIAAPSQVALPAGHTNELGAAPVFWGGVFWAGACAPDPALCEGVLLAPAPPPLTVSSERSSTLQAIHTHAHSADPRIRAPRLLGMHHDPRKSRCWRAGNAGRCAPVAG
jgi:hypothetical protein